MKESRMNDAFNTNDTSVADSLESSPALVPHMPYLLQDLWALGGSVDQICTLVGGLGLKTEGPGILDLGCGKGAVGIRLASRFGIKITGVDLMDPFLQEAAEKAEAYQVSGLCSFLRQDIREYVKVPHAFDAVILASLGHLLGPVDQTVAILRTQIASGGYMIIDDGYLKTKDRLDRKGYEHCRNHAESMELLTRSGDRLLEEVDTTAVGNETNWMYLEKIVQRGRELIAMHPALEQEIQAYLRLQEEECTILEQELTGALWLLRKT